MDAQTFDRWTVAITNRPSRRTALRLLAGGLLGGLLTQRGVAPSHAQRPDRDGDGLFDDDEVDIYGTNPDVFDTDLDGVGDGEEIYLGTDPRTPTGGVGCAPGLTDCGGVCVDLANDRNHCGGCGAACAEFVNCWDSNCGGVPPVQTGCGAGLTDCDFTCVDLLSNPYHCGACRNTCPLESTCQGGFCTAPPVCPAGQTRCDYCADLDYDALNCGGCGRSCPAGLVCCGGDCVDIASDPLNCGRCHGACFTPVIGDATCENYQCN